MSETHLASPSHIPREVTETFFELRVLREGCETKKKSVFSEIDISISLLNPKTLKR